MGKPLSHDTLNTVELLVRIERARERSRRLIAETERLRRESRTMQAAAALKRLQFLCLAEASVRRERRCRERIEALRSAAKAADPSDAPDANGRE